MPSELKADVVNRILGGPIAQAKGKLKSGQGALQRLRSREEIAASRSRLECLILQQYRKSIGRNKRLVAEVESIVRAFLKSQDDMQFSDERIKELEAKVRAALDKERDRLREESKKAKQGVSKDEVSDRREGEVEVSAPPEPRQPSLPEVLIHPDWSTLNAIVSAKDEREEAQSRLVDVERRRLFRGELDQQVEQLRRRQAEEKRLKASILAQSMK